MIKRLKAQIIRAQLRPRSRVRIFDEVNIKYPKQWNYWCTLANLRPAHLKYQKRGQPWSDIKGLGRRWRVDCYGQLCCGDTHAEFDRWALSHYIARAPIPKTQAEFLATVERLKMEVDDYAK